jgi:hypothetical protein
MTTIYAAGFDEASGNAQSRQLRPRRPGATTTCGAEAQDYSGTNKREHVDALGRRPSAHADVRLQPGPGGDADRQLAGRDRGREDGRARHVLARELLGDRRTSWSGVDGSGAANDGCTALTNGAAVAGKIVLLDRGLCAFTSQAINAQNAGAVGS